MLLYSLLTAVICMISPVEMQQAGKLDGVWKVESMHVDGTKAPTDESKKFELTVKNGTYAVAVDGKKIDEGKLVVSASKKPYEMDAKSELGPTKGQTMKGIYETVEGGFRVCFAPFGQPRPSNYDAKAGTGHILIVYKK